MWCKPLYFEFIVTSLYFLSNFTQSQSSLKGWEVGIEKFLLLWCTIKSIHAWKITWFYLLNSLEECYLFYCEFMLWLRYFLWRYCANLVYYISFLLILNMRHTWFICSRKTILSFLYYAMLLFYIWLVTYF